MLLNLRKKLKPDGSLFILYLALYAAWRLGIDFLRVGNPFFFSLHEAQFISIIVLLITVPWMIKNTRWVFSLRWYGIFLTLAVVWVIFWMWLQVKKGAQISLDTILSMALVGIPSGLIFARLLHVIDDIVIASSAPGPCRFGQGD